MLIRTITLAAAVVSSIVASPGIAQDDVEPEFDITMHDYWGSVSYADYPGQAGGLAFTWVDAEDGELGEHPTQDTSPGVLRIHYREDAEGCSVDIEMAMREYFPRFEFIELVVGGETFELTRYMESEEQAETRARVRVFDTILVLDAFGPAETFRVIVTD
ncbi:MAG TPA: hypothetical protein VKP88_02595 [Candidatus Paceibacterota bacterium]|nr:hypothetical protein [Candidatus Paceibacterota bacterium]